MADDEEQSPRTDGAQEQSQDDSHAHAIEDSQPIIDQEPTAQEVSSAVLEIDGHVEESKDDEHRPEARGEEDAAEAQPPPEETGDQEHTDGEAVGGETTKPDEGEAHHAPTEGEDGEVVAEDAEQTEEGGEEVPAGHSTEDDHKIEPRETSSVVASVTEGKEKENEPVEEAEEEAHSDEGTSNKGVKDSHIRGESHRVASFADDLKPALSVAFSVASDEDLTQEQGSKTIVDDSTAFENFTLEHGPEADDKLKLSRDDLASQLREAKAKSRSLKTANEVTQNKIADVFYKRKKSIEHEMITDKNAPDPEQLLLRFIGHYEELRAIYSKDRERAINQLQTAKEQSLCKKKKADIERMKFLEYKKQVALKAVGRQSGKPVPPKDVEMAIVREEQREYDLINVRLENIKLKYTLKKQRQDLKKREEFAEGLHLFDFELLKIENETCNEKIEERNEELHKLRKKNASTVQILTHLKEKLKSVQRENLAKKTSLKDVETDVAQTRQALSRTKQARDVLRKDNQKLGYNSGLMGHGGILRDLERSVDLKECLLHKLEELKKQHELLMQRCVHIKHSITLSRIDNMVQSGSLSTQVNSEVRTSKTT